MGVFDIFHINHETRSFESIRETSPFIKEFDMARECTSLANQFYVDGKASLYEEVGIAERLNLASSFYDGVRQAMGIDAALSFVPMRDGEEGGYKPLTNTIELNMNLLERPDCSGVLNTILHEARHAFQMKAIEYPNSVSVDADTISTWRDNFENYISPELDYEEYKKQPVEADAFAYADNMVQDTSYSNMVA